MALMFSDFYRLNQLAQLNLRGNFSTTWDGTYLANANGKEPNPGSGLISGALPMHDQNALPVPIQALLQRRGLIYIFVSTSYPILYVGISESDLQTGVFGPGRFSHHVRKLLAALGGGTNHTGGWTEHAVQRYRDFVHALEYGGATLEGTSSHLCGDWRFAFASCDSPKQHEGFVLDQLAPLMRDFWGNVTILNTGAVKRVPIELQLPPNLATVVAQAAPQREAPIVEMRVEPPMPELRVANDAAAEQYGRAMNPLGGEDHIDGIDPVESLEDPDQWDEELDRALQLGQFPSNRPGNWTLLPSSPARCSEKILVDIRNTSEILPLLDQTVAYLGRCTGVKLVVFHIGGDIGYVKWMRALLVNLPVMQSLSPEARFITRVGRSWMPRACQRSCWMGAMGNGTSGNGANYQVPLGSRAVFKHRIWLLEELGLLKHDFGFIALHTDQPTQPPAGSDLSFGTLKTAKIMDWKARLYFGDTLSRLPLGFSERLLRSDAPPVSSINGAWIAVNRSAFSMNPYAWINQAYLDDCRLGA